MNAGNDNVQCSPLYRGRRPKEINCCLLLSLSPPHPPHTHQVNRRARSSVTQNKTRNTHCLNVGGTPQTPSDATEGSDEMERVSVCVGEGEWGGGTQEGKGQNKLT